MTQSLLTTNQQIKHTKTHTKNWQREEGLKSQMCILQLPQVQSQVQLTKWCVGKKERLQLVERGKKPVTCAY